MSSVFLSVIICTRNRADEIIDCLPHVAAQAKQFPDVEVVVVDNGSTDNTKDVVERASRDLVFPFRYVYEPVTGLCQARNHGRARARGAVLAYIDDDEEVAPGWVAGMREHFLAKKSDCLAGRVGVRLKAEPPFVVDEEMMWFFCTTALGDEPRFLSYPEHPIGGSMAFTTEVFDTTGGFDTNLKLYGDETEFFRRASGLGFTAYYNPEILANQVVPANRLTKTELRFKSLIRGKGAASVWLLGNEASVGSRISKILEYALRTGYVGARSVTGRTFGRFFTFWFNWGFLKQLISGIEVK